MPSVGATGGSSPATDSVALALGCHRVRARVTDSAFGWHGWRFDLWRRSVIRRCRGRCAKSHDEKAQIRGWTMARKTGKRLREQLYDAGNVLCPLCLSPFTREQASSGRIVTLEHVPPKFLGGRARCLTCKNCNAGTGRDVDQVAAMTKQPTKVTVDIQGKRDSYYISREGKQLTPAFGGFTSEDILNLMNSESREATMIMRVPKPEMVAASRLKAGYLAIFCLLGPGSG